MDREPPDAHPTVPGLGSGVLPRYQGRGIGNVAASLADALDASADDLLPHLDQDVLPPELVDGADRVVLLVVDGLGWEAYRDAAPGLEALPRLAREGAAAPITSVLPSTTATALTTLHLGAAPARHGLVAPYAHLDEEGVTANLLRWTTADGAADLADAGIGVEDVVQAPGLAQVLEDCDVAALTRDDYVGSPLSEVLYRGADVTGYEDLPDLARKAPEALGAGGADLLLAYWDGLDAVGHLRGPEGEAWEAELARIDAAVGDLAGDLPEGTLLVVTSDHGFVPTPKPLALDLDDHPDLREHLARPATGEVRWRFLEADDPEAVRAYVAGRLDHAVDVLDQGALLKAGVYGPGEPGAEVRARYGDLVLVPGGQRSVRVRHGDEPPPHLAGHHGGPAAEEVLVPLLAWPSGREP